MFIPKMSKKNPTNFKGTGFQFFLDYNLEQMLFPRIQFPRTVGSFFFSVLLFLVFLNISSRKWLYVKCSNIFNRQHVLSLLENIQYLKCLTYIIKNP